ncbi:MAG: hypothetical protein JWQ04_3424, partial [Pedosphaera sp.]|nr:hypothetical protein [Pedosphaera sp.]
MNDDFLQKPQAELEARVTALLLGELTGAEAASLRQAIEDDPQLAALHERLKKTVVLVREVAASPIQPAAIQSAPLKLSEERRQKLLAQFKTVTLAPKETTKPHRKVTMRLVELAAVLALMAVLAGLLMPSLAKSKSKAVSVSIRSNLRQIELAKRMWASDNNKSATDVPTLKDMEPYMGRGSQVLPPSIAGEKYVIGRVGESPSVELDAADAKKLFGKPGDARLSFGGLRSFEAKPSSESVGQQARIDANGR